jgi:hypothetical protein
MYNFLAWQISAKNYYINYKLNPTVKKGKVVPLYTLWRRLRRDDV